MEKRRPGFGKSFEMGYKAALKRTAWVMGDLNILEVFSTLRDSIILWPCKLLLGQHVGLGTAGCVGQ